MIRKPVTICIIVFLLLVLLGSPYRVQAAQSTDEMYRILGGINAIRITNGLPPFALNALLTQAAQAHSEYQRDSGQITHDGPGGTRTLDRVLAVGYPAIRANENIYAGMGGPEQAVAWWAASTAGHVQNILHPVLREVGIGAAPAADGMTYYTVDFSAQPNVLPVFVNNDAYSTGVPEVILILTNERVFSGAPGQIGLATQVMISNSPDFSGGVTLPWSQTISWTLDTSTGLGVKTVYIRFIDAAGRTADSQDVIVLSGSAAALPTVLPTQVPTLPPQPTTIPLPTTIFIQPTSTPPPTPSPNPIPTFALETLSPTSTLISGAVLPPDSSSPDSSEEAVSAVRVLGLPTARWRRFLTFMLAMGIGAGASGLLGLLRHRRYTALHQAEES